MNMNHITKLNIKTYRGINNLDLPDLGSVNIFLGDNNSGKTSVLEVIRSLEAPNEIVLWRKIALRGQIMYSRDSFFDALSLLPNVNNKNAEISYSVSVNDSDYHVNIAQKIENIEITKSELKNKNGFYFRDSDENESDDTFIPDVQKMTFEFTINGERTNIEEIYNIIQTGGINNRPENRIPLFNNEITYISPVQHVESRPFLSKVLNYPSLYESMLDILREFDPGIISINADKTSNEYSRRVVYKILSKDNEIALPLNVYGDGMKKAILLMCAVVVSESGILLIDEYETAIHTSAMKNVFRWILNSCKKLNVQLFMTTHSIEAVDKLLESAETTDDIRIIRLKKKNGNTISRTLNGTEALNDRKIYNMELRT